MLRLGYDRYGAQGGDWVSAVARWVGRNRGHCIAIHTNMLIAWPHAEGVATPTVEEQDALAGTAYCQDLESGYAKQQSTRPQTIGCSLIDSLLGQLAWIVEKFAAWIECVGRPENVVHRDELLDNVMLTRSLAREPRQRARTGRAATRSTTALRWWSRPGSLRSQAK